MTSRKTTYALDANGTSLKIAVSSGIIELIGQATLLASWNITVDTGTMEDPIVIGKTVSFTILYRAQLTQGENHVTIFGKQLTSGQALGAKALEIRAYYNGTGWDVFITEAS